MRLVHNAKQAWRWFSLQSMAMAIAIQAAWVNLPDDMRAPIPSKYVAALTIAILILGAIGRLVDQGEPK